MKKRIFLTVFLLFLIIFSYPGEKSKQFKTWKLPPYMRQNIQFMMSEFNRQMDQKIKDFIVDLKKNHKGFSDMPMNVRYDHEMGLLFKPEDFEQYNKEKKAAIGDIQKQVNQKKPIKKEEKKE